MDVVLIGAGNLATHLGPALQKAGHQVLQVYSRTRESASLLADKLGCPWTTEVEGIQAEGQLYVFSLRDAVLQDIASRVYSHLGVAQPSGNSLDRGREALFIHTAGSMPVTVFPSRRRGVLYPMQTFSKSREVDFREIPIFVESPTDEALLLRIAAQLSHTYRVVDESQRRTLHLAAVFACNFSNHMYDLSSRLLAEQGLPFQVMLPLIDETARKVHLLSPAAAQTGPAVRFDENVMQRHLDYLENETDKEIYKLLSKSIHDRLRPDQD